MEALIKQQSEILEKLKQINTNFDKDSATRKTSEYLAKRLKLIDDLWGEFESHHVSLGKIEGATTHEYFTKNVFTETKEFYHSVRIKLATFNITEDLKEDASVLLSQQRTNFRALTRLIKGISVDQISEKWELEDELRNVQSRWNIIDNLHLQIDNILQGGDLSYEDEFYNHEIAYKNIKRELNQKMSSTVHIHQSTPQLEIPVFTGNYTSWPTFRDLYTEAIHNNKSLSKAQKMQHLKGKLRGEAERLIQHLNISAANYDTAWELVTHRFNNPQALFTKHIEILLSIVSMNKQSGSELKKLHDTTLECIHAIHNLGVDTTTWDPLLVHLLSKKLDSDTYTEYRKARKAPKSLASFDEFMEFLENKFIALEEQNKKEKNIASTSRPQQHPRPFPRRENYQGRFQPRNHQVVHTFSNKCPLCSFPHDLFRCKRFINLSADEKLSTVSRLNVCPNCLYRHYDNKCNSTKRCKDCNSDHNTLMHDAYARSFTQATTATNLVAPPQPLATAPSANYRGRQHCVNHVATDDEEILLTTLLLKIKSADGTYVTLRALLDQGSQIALISENAAQMLGLHRQGYHASVSGIGATPKQARGIVSLECQSIYNDYEFTTQALVISRVISNLPNVSFGKRSWPHLQNINLADPDYNISKSIDILLDASIYSDIIMNGLIKGPSHAPIAQQTKMGWILSGNVKTFNCHVVINNLQDIAKYWEVEDISSPSSNMTQEEQYCEELYQSTTRRLEDGRYEVALPMKPDYEKELGSSKGKALAQFRQLENKMSKNDVFANEYKKFMCEYETLDHMRPVSNNTEPVCYLPHHGVLKLDSTTTKLRTVFNASCKTSTGKSLNDLMEAGPNLQHDLQELILSWRQYQYVITADIEKMFRQILVRKEDLGLQSIIWRYAPHESLQDYHLTTVTYGTKAAPYLAMRTLRQLAIDDGDKYPLAAAALKSSFYMDDLMSGQDTIEQARELRDQLIQIFKGAGMNLRKWSANHPDLINDLSSNQIDTPFDFKCTTSRKTLGLRWNPVTDDFTFQNKLENNKCFTKRQLLSDISKTFDPLGWLTPITVKTKLMFQKVWETNVSWDEDLPSEIQKEWQSLKEDFKNIDKFSIPRYFGNIRQSYELHGFSDASEKAYACTVYLLVRDNKGACTSTLVAAKTKLAPLNKKVSLPRLELLGALLLSQLIRKVKESISSEHVSTYAWTDSMIVLGWLQGDTSRWKQFVANRVKQIIEIIPSQCWRHVISKDNPADCATRGLSSSELMQHSLWWQGPGWLKNFSPESQSVCEIPKPEIEAKKASVNVALQEQKMSWINELLNTNSSLTKVVNTIAWVSRFVSRLRHKQTGQGLALSSFEINNAYQMIIKDTQSYDFKVDLENLREKGQVHNKSTLSPLNPYLDENGIMRVGGRLSNAHISSSAKHPIIISNRSRFTTLLINLSHILTLHGGPRLTLSQIREKYWIISGMRTVKRELRFCTKCRRYNSEKRQQIMADLPSARVTPSRPFTNTGVDFTGHFDIKSSKGRGIKSHKGYVAVFVCLATKAIHLELVSDLSTPAFLAAFQRFCARRGSPSRMYSDNGTNFVGANRLLKKEYQAILATINEDFFSKINHMDIKWNFNSPSWPSAGGLWEAAVKSFKKHLKRVLGEQMLTYEEFTTLLYQIEACLNSRPLLPLTENVDDEVLTSGHFLIGDSLLSRPQPEPENITLPTRWQLVQSMNKQFWKLWSMDYLQHLQTRSKWRTPSKNLEVNDVVLVKEDNLPPGKWALGRVQEVHPGKDGYVRVVSLKTKNNVIKRPVCKLIELPVHREINTPDKQDNPQDQSQTSQYRKPKQRRPRKMNLVYFITSALLLFMTIITPTVQRSNYYPTTTIFAHYHYLNKISMPTNIEAPERSILNKLINDTLIERANNQPTDHSIHDGHHYALGYVSFAIIIVASVAFCCYRVKGRRRQPRCPSLEAPVQLQPVGQQQQRAGRRHRPGPDHPPPPPPPPPAPSASSSWSAQCVSVSVSDNKSVELKLAVKDCLHLQLYREPRDRLRKGQAKASLSLQQFLGFESGFTLDKESNTIAILCRDVTVVLAFETRERLIAWQVKVGAQLGASREFLVMVGGGGARKLPAGPARLHVRGRRFALTSGVPPRLLGLWELAHLRRYGVVEGRFCFEGGSHCGKGEGLHMLLTDQAQEITDAFDQAAGGNLTSTPRGTPSRKSAGAERDSKMRPSTRLSDLNTVDQSLPDTSGGLYEENFFGDDCGRVSPYWPSDERRFEESDHMRSDIDISAKPPWSEADHVTLERCTNCLTKLGAMSRSSTVALTPTTHFNPAWTMEAVPETNSDFPSNTEYLTPRMLRKTFEACNDKPPMRPPKPGHFELKKPPARLPIAGCPCTGEDNMTYPSSNPKVGPYENYDVPKATHVDQVDSGEYYDTPKRIRQVLADDLFQVTKSSSPGSLVLKKNCGCILKFASKKKPLIVECEENLQPVECPCQKVTNWANNLISLPYCKREPGSEKVNTEVLTSQKQEEMAIYATVDVSRKTNRQSNSVSDKDNTPESAIDTAYTNYQNIEPSSETDFEGPYANYENLEFALSLEYYENAKDLLKKAGVTQSELDALSANIDLANKVIKKPKMCTKCCHTQNNQDAQSKAHEYLLMEPKKEGRRDLCKTVGPNDPGYTPMKPNPNWSQSLKHPAQKMHKVDIEKSQSIPALNGDGDRTQTFNPPANNNKDTIQKRSSSVDSAPLLEDLKEFDSSIGSHAISSSLETLRNLAIDNRRSSTPCDNDREYYDCCKSSGSENKTSEESSSKDGPHLRNKHMDTAQIKRSSSVPCKTGGNRDSSSSNDSGVSSCSMKHGEEFHEFEMPMTSGHSRYQYMLQRRMRGNMSMSGCLHSSLPRKSKSSDLVRDQSMSIHKNNISAKSSSAEAEVPVLPPKQFKGVVDSRSTSSGTSDMSDYIETLSLTSSHSSSDTPPSMRLGRQPTSTLRPRSGKEYHNLDPRLTSLYKTGQDLAHYTNIP